MNIVLEDQGKINRQGIAADAAMSYTPRYSDIENDSDAAEAIWSNVQMEVDRKVAQSVQILIKGQHWENPIMFQFTEALKNACRGGRFKKV